MKHSLISLALIAACSLSQAADLDNKPDVTTFDIAGVKLGMSPEEAQAALKSKYPNGELGKLQTKGSPLDYKIKIPSEIEMKDGNQKVIVYFSTNTLNGKPEEAVVSRIMYNLPNTDDNLKALQQAAKEKYGIPTLGEDSTLWRWCQNPEKVFAYECVSNKTPTLTLTKMMSVYLDLSTPAYRDAEQKAIEAAKSTKPSI